MATPREASEARLCSLPGRGVYLGAAALRQPDRGQADPTGGGVDEDPLTGAQVPDVARAKSAVTLAISRPAASASSCRSAWARQRGGARDVAAEAPRSQGDHRVADVEIGDAGADRDDDAGALAADRARVARVHAQDVEDVLEVETSRVHTDLDLARAGRSSIRLAETRWSSVPRSPKLSSTGSVGAGWRPRASRAASRSPRRTASWSSSSSESNTSTRSLTVSSAGDGSRSRQRGCNSGCSRATVLANPTAALARRRAWHPPRAGPPGSQPQTSRRPFASACVRRSAPPRRSFITSDAVPPVASRPGGRPPRRTRGLTHRVPAGGGVRTARVDLEPIRSGLGVRRPGVATTAWPPPSMAAPTASPTPPPSDTTISVFGHVRRTGPGDQSVRGARATITVWTPPSAARALAASGHRHRFAEAWHLQEPDPPPSAVNRSDDGLRSVSTNFHQPSVRPNVIEMKRWIRTISTITSRPSGASSFAT